LNEEEYEHTDDDFDDFIYDDFGEAIEINPDMSEADVDRILVRLASVRAEMAEIDLEHAQMVDRYDTWRERVRKPHQDAERLLVDAVSQWALARIESNPEGPKSFDLPSGAISTRAGGESVEIDNDEIFLVWAVETGHDELTRRPPQPLKPDRKAIKAAIEEGEIIEGARLVVRDRTVKVYTEEAI
jgi:hypothetical protein